MGASFTDVESPIRLPTSPDDAHPDAPQFQEGGDELPPLSSQMFHDVNNRLLVIKFACDKLLRGLSSDDSSYSTVLAIDEARQHISDLAHQFRDVQKAVFAKDSGTDLNDVVCRWKPLIVGVARENVIIETDLTSKPAIVAVCDETVERILLHLCLSALAIISDGGWLNIHTSHIEVGNAATSDLSVPIPSGSVRLSISDTSCVEADLTASVGPASKEVLSSTIKNAAIRRSTIEAVGKIVRDCGGQISVMSSSESGTRIDIFLPKLSAIQFPSVTTFDCPPDVTGNETILLVDDDARVRNFIKFALESHGYKVIEAHDGCSAISAASEHTESLHLLVTDLRLGGTSGREIADRLRSDYPGLPVIFMSGLASDDLGLDASSDFLEKPFKPIELIEAVRKLLDVRRSGANPH